MTIATEALARWTGASGPRVSLWKMGGNVEAAGQNLAIEGLHAFVTESLDDHAEALLVVGWDAPATEAEARELLLRAAGGTSAAAHAISRAGDDTFAVAGSLDRVMQIAIHLVELADEGPEWLTCDLCRARVSELHQRVDLPGIRVKAGLRCARVCDACQAGA